MAVHPPNPDAVLNARRIVAAARDIRQNPPPPRSQSPRYFPYACTCVLTKCATAREHWVVEEETAELLDDVLKGVPLPDSPVVKGRPDDRS